jgi:hypothetical protein
MKELQDDYEEKPEAQCSDASGALHWCVPRGNFEAPDEATAILEAIKIFNIP